MVTSLSFETKTHLIHPFRAEDIDRIEVMGKDIYEILTDARTLSFIPEKHIQSLAEAESFLLTSIINYHAQRNYLQFITDKGAGKVIGMIDLISPELAREHYQIDHYPYFIEFYLGSHAIGKGIMGDLLPTIAKHVISQGIPNIGAVVNRKNLAAVKVLNKANFSFKKQFDLLQDLYTLTQVINSNIKQLNRL